MPDIFVPQDTTGYSDYYSEVVRKSLVNKFAFRFVDSHRNEISALRSASQIEAYLDRNNVLGQFYDYAARNGIKRDHSLSGPALKQMRTSLYGNIIYDSLDMEDYITFFNETDVTVQRAVSILSEK